MAEVVIIGGGISGLATAYYLQQQGVKDLLILEAGTEAGGKLQTSHFEDYLIESGPDAYVSTKPVIGDLIRELGLQEQVIQPQQNTFFIYSRKKLQEVPAGLSAMVPSDMGAFLRTGLISWQGKIRLVLERLVPPRKGEDDESLAAFIERRFGREMLEKLAGPLFAGIHSGAADELSLEASFPQFRKMEKEFGSITRAVLARRKAAPPPPVFLSFKNGMQTLTNALQQQIPKKQIRLGCKVRGIAFFRDQWKVRTESEQIDAEKVILAVPAYAAAEILRDLDRTLSSELGRIRFSPSTVVTFGLRKEQVRQRLKGTGFLVPAKQQEMISAATFSSSKWPGRAAKDRVLIRAFLNKAMNATAADEKALAKAVWQALSSILGITGEAEFAELQHWPSGQPVYKMGHLEGVQKIETLLQQHPGIFVTGASYRGAGIADCVRQAKDLSDRLNTKTG